MDAATDPAWPRLVEEVQRAFAGSPYRVDVEPDAITVIADLADARFLGVASVRRFRRVYRTRLAWKGPRRVTWEDAEETLTWSAGIGGDLVPRLSGRVSGTRGRIAMVELRKEVGVDEHGPGTPVDYAFSSAEIARPLRQALQRAGVRSGMAASTIAGIVAAAVGGLGAIAVGVAALLGAFSG